MQKETGQEEHNRLMTQARCVIAGAGLRGISSVQIREAKIWLQLHRPITAMRTVGEVAA